MKRLTLPSPASVLAAALLPLLACSAAGQASCKLVDIGTATVAAVRDGRTLLLADGRELRLAAIEVTGNSRELLQQLVANCTFGAEIELVLEIPTDALLELLDVVGPEPLGKVVGHGQNFAVRGKPMGGSFNHVVGSFATA